MATAQLNQVLQQLRRIHQLREEADLNDGDLLDRFCQHGDQTACEILIQRYGSMVLGVCQRILRDTHDSEDAFQAVFLVLVKKGNSLRGRQTIGNWLYGVAYHTALKARATAVQRRCKESQAPVQTCVQPAEDDSWQELRPLLDQELNRLPDKFREAVVLCDVLGKSRKQAARQLGIPEGTLSSRLATARRLLSKRLKHLGVPMSGGALAVILSQKATAASVAPPLAACTLKAASALATGATAASMMSPAVASLVEGVLHTMFVSKCKTVLAFVLAFVFLAAGLAGLSAFASPQEDNQSKVAQVGNKKDGKEQPKKDEPKKDDDVRVLDNIGGIDQVTLEGKAKKLLIKSIGAGAKVDCGNLEVEELEIEKLDGVAQVKLNLADKAKLKKLTIGAIGGAAKIDGSQLDVETIQIKNISGLPNLTLQANGDITIKNVGGGQLTVAKCKNLTVDAVTAIPTLNVQATEDVHIKVVSGGKVKVARCRDIVVDTVAGIPNVSVTECRNVTVGTFTGGTVQANYTGEGKVQNDTGNRIGMINLKKIESPK